MSTLIDAQTATDLAAAKRALDKCLPETSKLLFGVIERLSSEVARQGSIISSAVAEGTALEQEVTRLRTELQQWVAVGLYGQKESPAILELACLELERNSR